MAFGERGGGHPLPIWNIYNIVIITGLKYLMKHSKKIISFKFKAKHTILKLKFGIIRI